ncbi:MAG: nucleotidyl transferase AbiEii/AbiGii toxin family protein [Gemmataceae bacterium]
MDEFLRRPMADRAALFAEVATRRGLTAPIIEKDFWVCWTLRHLFSLPDLPAGLIFKGGTSLSKVFSAIDRFSEDVDLSFDRQGLGFGGENDPAAASGSKPRMRQMDALTGACRAAIKDVMLPRLHAAFTATLADVEPMAWSLSLDADDPDQQTLLFGYPSAAGGSPANLPPYVRPAVRLELGARGDHWPAVEATIRPYVAEHFPDLIPNAAVGVKALAAERTFWEKATILHKWHHAASDKPFGERVSRHYYDVVRLYEQGHGARAIGQPELLAAVSGHMQVYFATKWARFDLAVPGTLRLVPPEARLPALREDYAKMREMFFTEPPPLERLLAVLTEIEESVNRTAAGS